MNRFTYSRGQWVDGMPLPEPHDNEEWEAYLKRIGLSRSPTLSIGDEVITDIDIFVVDEEAGSYLASVTPTGYRCYDVFLPDFPSLMLFIKEYAPAFSAICIQQELATLRRMGRKLFRMYHGHDAGFACQDCDPMEWERIKRIRESQAHIRAVRPDHSER